MIRTAWTLTKKDLRLFLRDRAALLLTLALPLLLATVFGSAMGAMSGGGGGGGPKAVRLLVEDLDGSSTSVAVVEALRDSDGLRTEVGVDVERAVRNGDAGVAVVIPAGYGAAFEAGEVPRLRLLRDPSAFLSQQLATVHVTVAVGRVLVQRLGDRMMPRMLDAFDFPGAGRERADAILGQTWDDMSALMAQLEAQGAFADDAGGADDAGDAPAEAGDATPDDTADDAADAPFDLTTDVPALLGVDAEDVAGERAGGLPPSAGASHAIAAMAVMMLMFSVVGAGGTILEERDGGTLLRLLLAPGAGAAVLLGKFWTICVIGLLQLAVLFAFGALAFDVPVLEHPVALGLTALVEVYAVTGLGLFFATVCRSRKQLEGLSTVVILVMSAVGGAWFPREMTPDWFQTAGLFTMTAWAMDAYHGVLWYGKGVLPGGELDGVWPQLLVLLAMGGVLHLAAVRLFRRRFVLHP